MSNDLKREYYEIMCERYKKASKKEKTKILDEIQEVTKHNRKYTIRKLNKLIKGEAPKKKRGRKPYYSEESKFHLRKLWIYMKQMCSKKIKAALPLWLSYYKAPDFTDSVKKELLKMSASSIDRFLKPHRVNWERRKQNGTKRTPSWVEKVIPIKALDFQVSEPGFIQADTVHHCGESLSGTYACTVTMTDIHLDRNTVHVGQNSKFYLFRH